MQRIGNLNWENITYDHDISGLVRGLTDWGVIEGGTVVGNKLQPVQAIVPLVRSNGQKILAFFESDEVIDLPTTGDYKVYIEVDQAKIDFGGNNAEDGTGIAGIKTWPSVPSQNFLLLATVTSWVAKDERNLIPKIQSVAQKTDSLESEIKSIQWWISSSSLTKKFIVWEKLLWWDKLWVQFLPKYDNCSIWYEIWRTQNNAYLHIQRFSSEFPSDKIKVKVRKVWSPTTALNFTLQWSIDKTPTVNEIAWVGDWVIKATGSIQYTDIEEDWKEFEVQLSWIIGWNEFKNKKISIVVSQTNWIVNNDNYYEIACDSSQYSEALRLIADTWSGDYIYTKFVPFCNSISFLQNVLWRNEETIWVWTWINEKSQVFSWATIAAYWSVNYTPTSLSVSWTVLRYKIKPTEKNRLRTTMKVWNKTIFSGQYLSNPMIGKVNKSNWDAVFFTWFKDSWGTNVTFETVFTFFYFVSENISLSKKNMLAVVAESYTEKTVWDELNCTISWFLPDWTFFWGDFYFWNELENSATAWTIPPINAVWYKIIKDENWKKYKIRVYWE